MCVFVFVGCVCRGVCVCVCEVCVCVFARESVRNAALECDLVTLASKKFECITPSLVKLFNIGKNIAQQKNI